MTFPRLSFLTCLALSLPFTFACDKESTAPQVGTAVNVKDNEFEPLNLQLTAGQTVTWTWSGTNPHTVTFDAGAFGSTQMATGTFQHQFTAPGTFTYHCLVHATMTGTITVQ